MQFINKHFWKIIIVIAIVLGIASYQVINQSKNPEESQTEVAEAIVPSLDVLTFGSWTPDGNRSVLLTIESDAEVDIVSELSATVGTIHAKAGDQVQKGQKLLTFNTSFDQAAINYQNAIQALESTKLNNQASIEANRIALENARNDLEQTRRQEDINFERVIDTLRTQAGNSEVNFSQAINLMDRWLGISAQFRYAQDMSRAAVGGRDGVGKQKNKNQVRELLRKMENLSKAPADNSLEAVFDYAQSRVNYARDLQEAFTLFESLVRGAVLNQSFKEANRQSLLGEINSIRGPMSADLLSLNNALKEGRTAKERKRLSILSAENRVKSAQTSYDVAISSANSQKTNAENQLRMAQVSQNDLVVRAPFSGVVSEKFINLGAQVNPGQQLFKLTNPKSSKKGVAFLSLTEYKRLNDNESLQIIINDEILQVEKQGVTARLDSQSQKMRVEFTLPNEAEASLIVGQIGKILLPSSTTNTNLLPLSSISFEPDGAEVLIVNEDMVTQRQKIMVGKLQSSAIEVTSGLENGSQIVQYRNRSYAGQTINIKP